MPTVQEVLRASGMSDAEIAAIDQKALTGMTTILSTAEQVNQQATAAKEAAERAERAQKDLLNNQINPALDQWGNEKTLKDAEIAFYKTQLDGAKANGFVPKDAPGYAPTSTNDQARNPQGQFVPGSTGSPQFMTTQQGLTALSNSAWVANEHMRLYGAPYPDDFDQLLREATDAHQPFKEYAAKKYKFEEKKAEVSAAKAKEHDDSIRKEAEEKVRREYAEKFGQNPNTAQGQPSRFSELQKGVATKERHDPLAFRSKQERHAATQTAVQREIRDNAVAKGA